MDKSRRERGPVVSIDWSPYRFVAVDHVLSLFVASQGFMARSPASLQRPDVPESVVALCLRMSRRKERVARVLQQKRSSPFLERCRRYRERNARAPRSLRFTRWKTSNTANRGRRLWRASAGCDYSQHYILAVEAYLTLWCKLQSFPRWPLSARYPPN